jgi:hypothetical protein
MSGRAFMGNWLLVQPGYLNRTSKDDMARIDADKANHKPRCVLLVGANVRLCCDCGKWAADIDDAIAEGQR